MKNNIRNKFNIDKLKGNTKFPIITILNLKNIFIKY